jgi:hypothetical protein
MNTKSWTENADEIERLRAINAELLAALQEFIRLDDDALGLLVNHPDYGGELVSALHDARAALTRATGEQS